MPPPAPPLTPEWYRGMMPAYLNPKPNQPDIDMFNHQLNKLPDLEVTSVKKAKYFASRRSNYLIGVPRLFNVSSDKEEDVEFLGETFQSEVADYPSKRQKIETPIKRNRLPWNDSSRLPSLQLSPDQKDSVPMKGFEEVYTPTTPVPPNLAVDEGSETFSGCSDITKLHVLDSSPWDNKHVQGLVTNKRVKNATRVYSFNDLHIIKREIQAEERPLKHEKLGSRVDVAEPMDSDEQKKHADTVPRKKRDVSLVERFTEEEIKSHIESLKEGSIQEKPCELEKELCQLCGHGILLFPAPPIYCSNCPRLIKDNSVYYIPEETITDAQHQICSTCYCRNRLNFTVDGVTIPRANMRKTYNTGNQQAENWVCCESCEKWQHEICGLYNQQKDEANDKTADYICPYCLLKERKSINNTGFADNTDLGAKDLPETILSHFIERRLSRRLREERHQTAKATDKSIDDVSEPDDLTVRVVFSADRRSDVNKTFSDLFHKEHYPSEFPYRSKVILLFQKIEGVDVCIFALFVQEFGSECSQPNQRSVYIFYLDSVKYFRPSRPTFSGEPLRTFVYHEILIGYLEYCKIRGFTTGYIWSCPPKKGEDYIMYSHPEAQQTPSTKKLRQWYLSMLDKAVEQRIVTNITNLYNQFFVSTEESTCNITAARLPYFEGSFWTSNAEVLTQEIERENEDELQKKVKSLSRRAHKGNKIKEGVDVDDAKNILLMRKLEKMISKHKEDLMVVELNYSCTRCSEPILTGLRWFCDKCKNLQLCERCHGAEQELPGEHTHTMNGKEKHTLSKAQVKGIQSTTTEDNDVIVENSTFESRLVFLELCKKHNYCFDTLRRAKHTSVMILHNLHASNKHQNSSSLFQVTCTACQKDVSKTVYYSCLICSCYRACTACYTKDKVRLLHLFPLLPSTLGTPLRSVGALGMIDALRHAHTCRLTATSSCSYPKCSGVKTLFNHSLVCETKNIGECKVCSSFQKMMNIHAYHCQDPSCSIPRCRVTKVHLTRRGWRL